MTTDISSAQKSRILTAFHMSRRQIQAAIGYTSLNFIRHIWATDVNLGISKVWKNSEVDKISQKDMQSGKNFPNILHRLWRRKRSLARGSYSVRSTRILQARRGVWSD